MRSDFVPRVTTIVHLSVWALSGKRQPTVGNRTSFSRKKNAEQFAYNLEWTLDCYSDIQHTLYTMCMHYISHMAFPVSWRLNLHKLENKRKNNDKILECVACACMRARFVVAPLKWLLFVCDAMQPNINPSRLKDASTYRFNLQIMLWLSAPSFSLFVYMVYMHV